MNPELGAKIQLWRQRAMANTLTREEMREAVEALRAGRMAAAETSSKASKAKGTAAAKKNLNSDDMLSELGI